MASTAIYSKTILHVSTGSAAPVLPAGQIVNITSIGGPNLSRADINVSTMESTAQEFKPAALADPGTLTFGLQFNPTNAVHQYIVSQSANNTIGNDVFRITFSDGTDWIFTGSFTEFSITADDPNAGILTADVSVRLTGAINFNP